MRKKITAFFSLTALMAMLCSCILVDDFGPRWAEAKPDICLSNIAKTIYITEFRRDPGDKNLDDLARGLTLDGQNYLLLKKNPEDKGGRIYRFSITAGKQVHATHVVMQRWRLDPSMRDTFLHDHPDSVAKINSDTVTLPNLEGESEKLLTEIANKPEYWQIEEQTLYNVLRDPKCRFDTRALTKEEEKFSPTKLYHRNNVPEYQGPHDTMQVPKGVQP